MLLGADFLLAHRVLIAHSQRKIYSTMQRSHVSFEPSRGLVTLAGSQHEISGGN